MRSAQFKQQIAAPVPRGIHRIHQAHPRGVVQVRGIADGGEDHVQGAVDVGLRNQGHGLGIARRLCASAGCRFGVCGQHQRGASAIGERVSPELDILELRHGDGVGFAPALLPRGNGFLRPPWLGDGARLHRLHRNHAVRFRNGLPRDELHLHLVLLRVCRVRPVIGKALRLAIGRVRDRHHLLHCRRITLKLRCHTRLAVAACSPAAARQVRTVRVGFRHCCLRRRIAPLALRRAVLRSPPQGGPLRIRSFCRRATLGTRAVLAGRLCVAGRGPSGRARTPARYARAAAVCGCTRSARTCPLSLPCALARPCATRFVGEMGS